jgi:site-specific DNA-methyltransferase (adenine-specific)
MSVATFTLRGRNPDVLSCIANLSNDEVFTPPEFANRMLDTLAQAWAADHGGASIWANPDVTFLDPCTKSGVFLREIAKRLIDGLAAQIPDLQMRVDHVLTRQVFGIGITELTAMLARRSLYCSKHANGVHSITRGFNSEAGNIWFERVEHTWTNGKCTFCGASQSTLDRGDDRESHAYAFIHTDNIQERVSALFGGDMQFDVVIGNPPYQLETDGHGQQARPIYHSFVEQAKALRPRYLSMIIPSRWFSGGMGLDEFRQSMLSDNSLRELNDYLTATDVFPGVGLKGGVCYFLWDREYSGDCTVTTRHKDDSPSVATRPLLEVGNNIFVRFNEGVAILKKVVQVEVGSSGEVSLPANQRFSSIVSSIGAYGLSSTFKGKARRSPNDLKVYRNGGVGYISPDQVTKEEHSFDKWKIFIGRAAPGTGNKDTYPHRIISTPFLGEPGSISSWTYMYIGPFDEKSEAESALSYLSCRLTRFLILLHKPSQDTTKRVYTFVPMQTWDRQWTDQMLYEKYGLTEDEIAFVEKIVRPMDMDLFDNPAED